MGKIKSGWMGKGADVIFSCRSRRSFVLFVSGLNLHGVLRLSQGSHDVYGLRLASELLHCWVIEHHEDVVLLFWVSVSRREYRVGRVRLTFSSPIVNFP